MLSRLVRRNKAGGSDLAASSLYDERSFFPALTRDLACAKREVLIESPFMTAKRVRVLLPILRKLVVGGVRVTVNTRQPDEHDSFLKSESLRCLTALQEGGVQILFTGGHHRKLVIVDRHITWEGSLNVLSQNDSCEIMRRIESDELALQMVRFIQIEGFLE